MNNCAVMTCNKVATEMVATTYKDINGDVWIIDFPTCTGHYATAR